MEKVKERVLKWPDTKDVLLATATLLAAVLAFTFLTYLFFARDLQSKETIMNRNNTGLILLDRSDRPFFRFYSANLKTHIPLSQIPEHTQMAIIAAEDKTFYRHPGFSIKAIVGALVADIKRKDLSYGGSTITQQLVKNSLLNSNKNFLRKYQEFILAQEIERRYSKDQILEMYLNSVYFGEGAFGIEEAAQTYFGKTAQDLNLAESSILAALLPAPSRLSPRNGDLQKTKLRQEYVLEEMVSQSFITKEEKDQFLKQELVLVNKNSDLNSYAPHFALMVRDELIAKYGEEKVARSGYKVKTTLDLPLQKYAEEIVQNQVKNLEKNKVSNGAAVVENPKTGEVLALVGSADWSNEKYGKVNVTTSLRSPGSSFKPIVYAQAIQDRQITPATILNDSPITYNSDGTVASSALKSGSGVANAPYSPKNYDRKYRGKVTTRRALANSLNIPSVEVMAKIGVPKTLEMARSLGISSLGKPSDYGLSLTLGTGEVQLLELTNVYATFANGGQYNPPTLISEIKDKNNRTVYSYAPAPKKVLDSETAFLISSILSDAKTRTETFGNVLSTPFTAAVKTGTAEDYRDALTLGYTPNIAVGVWVGNNSGAPMDSVAGSLGAAPIWKQLMQKYLSENGAEAFIMPSGIVAASGCFSQNTAFDIFIKPAFAQEEPKEASPSPSPRPQKEYFIKGTEPKKLFCPTPSPKPSPSEAEQAEPPKPEEKQPPSSPPEPPKEIVGAGGPNIEEEIKKQIKEQLEEKPEEEKKARD